MKDILNVFTKDRGTLGPICLGAVKLGDHVKDNDYNYDYDYDYNYESASLEFFLDVQTSSWKQAWSSCGSPNKCVNVSNNPEARLWQAWLQPSANEGTCLGRQSKIGKAKCYCSAA